jgi:diguanylate cyclase (GGDEF)-like protein
MLIRLNAALRRIPGWAILLGSLLMTAAVAWIDYRAGSGLEIAVFYLPPIVAVAWHLGRSAGVGFAVFTTLMRAVLDWVARPGAASSQMFAWNSAAQLLFFLFIAALVSLLAEQTVELRALAREDPLTGIPNRRAFFGALDRMLEWSRRQGSSWVLAYLDVDNFKKINDTRGHAVGDAVLQKVARTLREGTRRIDVVARLGGDEFALLLPETDAARAEMVVNKLLSLLDETMSRAGWGSDVSFSVGVITFAVPPDSIDTAVSMADACMYRVKARGKAGALFRIWPDHAALELPRGVAAAARISRE